MLTKANGKIAKLIFSKFKGAEDLVVRGFDYGGGDKISVASSRIGEGDDYLTIYAAFPNREKDVYLMFSDGEQNELMEELGGIQHYNENKEHLCLFHTVPTERPYFKRWGWSRHIIVRPLTILDKFPDSCIVDELEYRLRLVLPISEDEFKAKNSVGMDGLFELFENKDRDLITFEHGNA